MDRMDVMDLRELIEKRSGVMGKKVVVKGQGEVRVRLFAGEAKPQVVGLSDFLGGNDFDAFEQDRIGAEVRERGFASGDGWRVELMAKGER